MKKIFEFNLLKNIIENNQIYYQLLNDSDYLNYIYNYFFVEKNYLIMAFFF